MANASFYEMMEGMFPLLELNISNLSSEEQLQFFLEFEARVLNESVDNRILLDKIYEYRTERYLNMFVPPVLLLLGLCGNLMSLCILLSKAMIRHTTNIFFAVLAFADSSVLIIGLARLWVAKITGVDILLKSNWSCKLVPLVTHFSSHFSVWLIIAVTIIRYIAVSMPHKATRYCRRKIAARVIVSLAVLIAIVNVHFMWTIQLQEHIFGDEKITKCEAAEESVYFLHVFWPWIDAVLSVLGPFTLLAFFNTMIVVHTVRSTLWRRQSNVDLQTRRSSQLDILKRRRNSYLDIIRRRRSSHSDLQRKLNRNDIKVTATLLTVSFSFLVTTLPMAIVMVLQNQWVADLDDSNITLQTVSQRRLIRTIAEMLMYLNHSINFFLYCAVGQKFRDQIVAKFCGRFGSNSSITSSSHHNHLYCSRSNERRMYNRRESASCVQL